MNIISRFSTALGITALVACALPLTLADALAADCPAGKTAAGATKPGPTEPSKVTDEVISSIDLGSSGAALGAAFEGRKIRLRRLVVQPGGIVPWHSHEMRPSNIYILSGTITEYRSTCSVPIEHGPGDVTAEYGPLSHWWKNNTKKPTVILSADLLSPGMNPDESM